MDKILNFIKLFLVFCGINACQQSDFVLK